MDLTRCGHCGANFEPPDLAQPACRYCGTVLPHRVRAAEQAEIVAQLLADKNRDGVPDALEGLVALASAAKAASPPVEKPVVVMSHTVEQPVAEGETELEHELAELEPPTLEESEDPEPEEIAEAAPKKTLSGRELANRIGYQLYRFVLCVVVGILVFVVMLGTLFLVGAIAKMFRHR